MSYKYSNKLPYINIIIVNFLNNIFYWMNCSVSSLLKKYLLFKFNIAKTVFYTPIEAYVNQYY